MCKLTRLQSSQAAIWGACKTINGSILSPRLDLCSTLSQQHVLHLWSLSLAHLPTPLWKSQIAPLGMLHPLYGMDSPLITASLVRHSLLHFLLSHMAVRHLHHLHYHRLHLLLLAQCFILNSRPGSSANAFLHRPFPLLPDGLHGLSDHLTFLLCSTVVLVSVLD